jgi:DNA-binding NtrC family response regulator
MADAVPKVRMLLVDDDEGYVSTQSQWLEKQGYAVTPAASVEGAKERLKKDAQDLDLALIDMYMGPDKQGGLELVRLISEKYVWIVSIVVTAHADFENARKCMEAGAFSYIRKGEDPPELRRQMILTAFKKRPSALLLEVRQELRRIRREFHEMEELMQRVADELPPFAKSDAEDYDD